MSSSKNDCGRTARDEEPTDTDEGLAAKRPRLGDDDSASSSNDDSSAIAPLIHVPLDAASLATKAKPPQDVSTALVDALRRSGFLRITTPLVPVELQRRVLEAATAFLEDEGKDKGEEAGKDKTNDVKVVSHPTDPKRYAMLTSPDSCSTASPVLADYLTAMECTKTAVLRCLATGLHLDHLYFDRLHDECNSSLRLLRYAPGSAETGNRCKEHSDYGTITLLLTDGVSGLEAYRNNTWVPVPHADGALVVNAGSLLERWTNGQIPATLHRVAGPSSKGSRTPHRVLMDAVGKSRTSIAFFADPNEGVAATLLDQDDDGGDGGSTATGACRDMSVAEYIRWRSGGEGADRSGLAFTEEEEKRIRGQY